jgi:hypothetical protein
MDITIAGSVNMFVIYFVLFWYIVTMLVMYIFHVMICTGITIT